MSAACASAATHSQSWRVATVPAGCDTWATPPALFMALHREFDFTSDVAASDAGHDAALLARYFTKQQDALAQSWAGERVFCNPPYGRDLDKWCAKARHEAHDEGALVVYLLPARTGNRWFHEHVLRRAEIRFLRGRLKYRRGGGGIDSAPFDSMVVIWRPYDVEPRERPMGVQLTFPLL